MQLDLRHGAGERRTLRVGLFKPKFMRNHSSPNEYYQQVSKTAFKCIKVRFNSQFLDPCVYFLQVFPNPLVRSAELKCLLLILYHILFDTTLFWIAVLIQCHGTEATWIAPISSFVLLTLNFLTNKTRSLNMCSFACPRIKVPRPVHLENIRLVRSSMKTAHRKTFMSVWQRLTLSPNFQTKVFLENIFKGPSKSFGDFFHILEFRHFSLYLINPAQYGTQQSIWLGFWRVTCQFRPLFVQMLVKVFFWAKSSSSASLYSASCETRSAWRTRLISSSSFRVSVWLSVDIDTSGELVLDFGRSWWLLTSSMTFPLGETAVVLMIQTC